MFNKEELVALLLENGADTGQKDERGLTAKDHAQMQGFSNLAALIASYE